MALDGEISLSHVFSALQTAYAIDYSEGRVQRASLNPREYPGVLPYVDVVSRNLYQQIVGAAIPFDAVVSVPSGGNAWAESIARIAGQHQYGLVPHLRLKKKGRSGGYSVGEYWPVHPRARLLVVDDTVFTSVTAWSVRALLEDRGHTVAGFVFPVEIGTRGADYLMSRGYVVITTFDRRFFRTLGLNSRPDTP